MPNKSYPELQETLRGWLQMSQSEFGRAIGYDHSTVHKIEAGSRKPSRRYITKVCETFESQLPLLEIVRLFTAAGYIVSGQFRSMFIDDQLDEIRALYETAPPKEQTDVRVMLTFLRHYLQKGTK